MNQREHTPEEKAAIKDFFGAIREAKAGIAPYLEAAPAAVRRLAKAVYGHDNGQALVVAACLASIYNGSEARPVRLDDIRRLDWALLKDLLAVMVATGHEGFPDTEIRKAFEEVGGKDAVDTLHWYTTGGPHRAALARLIEFIVENSEASSARALRDMLSSIATGSTKADLSRLNYIDDDQTKDFVLVLDGLFGRDQGCLHVEDITEAFQKAEISMTR